MNNLILFFIGILFAEYIGDFILQSRKTAVEKSTNLMVLGGHIMDIAWSLIFYLIAISFIVKISIVGSIGFIVSYCLIHGIQDWYLWKFFKILKQRKFEKETDARIWEIGLDKKKTFKNMVKERVDKYYRNKEYAIDKMYYSTIGFDRLLHIITLLILCNLFFFIK